jgi:hypothetical protein
MKASAPSFLGKITAYLSLFLNLDANDWTILVFTLSPNFIGEFLVPVTFRFSGLYRLAGPEAISKCVLFGVKHIVEQNRLGLHCLRDVRFHSAVH